MPLDSEDDGAGRGAPGVEPGGNFVVFHAVRHRSQVSQPDGRAAAIGDDKRLEGGCVVKLAGRLDGVSLSLPLQGACRQVNVPPGQCGGYLIQPYLPRCEGSRIDLHADGVFLRSVHHDLGDAADHRDAGGDDVVGEFIHL